MADQGLQKINSLKQKWIGCQLLTDVVLAAAFTLLLKALLHYFLLVAFGWAALMFAVMAAIMFFIDKPWKITLLTVTAFLNQTYPDLEESAELMIKPTADLTLLQRLQLAKVYHASARVPGLPGQFTNRLKRAGVMMLFALMISFSFTKISRRGASSAMFGNTFGKTTAPPEKVLPQISSVGLTVSPPAYTDKPKRRQDKFTILAEEGASISWNIHTNIAVGHLTLLFNDKEQFALKPDGDKTTWWATRMIGKPGFYQVNIDGKLSELYQIEIIKDAPPQIHVKTPKQYTYIDAGEAPKVNLTTTISDDYGVSGALIYATVAKGSGEGVKFKEYKLPFGESFQSHKNSYNLQHLFDLPKLNMEPGDELYFYIEAQDNYRQKSRTDVFTVSIQDTAALFSMDDMVNGSNLKPEYFRSQRQIIMDTEKLLKSKDSLTKEKFNSTSGDIGIDQKMLRLRYGKFLGEEEESNVGGIANNAELAKVENFNNEAMIKDAITDKHDNAEDATYLDPGVKTQLKATLTEMWNAELHLRMYKPEEALPFEYKALRLLKDLQQKSRSYVAKTAYKPVPLKMEKRLSGSLDKILQPVYKQDLKPRADNFATLKNAVQILEQIRITRIYGDADKHTLQVTKQQLSIKASAQPAVYLSAVSALNRIMAVTHPALTDIAVVEQAVQKTLPPAAQVSQGKAAVPDMGLAQHYYENLKHSGWAGKQ